MSTILDKALDKDLEAILNKTLEEYDVLVSAYKTQATLADLSDHFAKTLEIKRRQELARSKSKNKSMSKSGESKSLQEKQATESKEKKEKQDVIYVLGNTIPQPNILVNDKLPSEGGVPKPKDSHEFAKEQGFKEWMDNIVAEKSRWAEFKNMIKAKFQKDIDAIVRDGDRIKTITSEMLKKMTFETSQKIQLVDMRGEMNMAAFAAKKIKKGDIIFYGGELTFSPKSQYSGEKAYNIDFVDTKNGILSVDGSQYGTMANFLSHLPDQEYADETYVFKDRRIKNQMATENFKKSAFWIEDLQMAVIVMEANRDIEAGEMLGWDYGPNFWSNARKVPTLFFKNAKPIPSSAYKSRKFSLNIIPEENPNDINASNLVVDSTWEDFKEAFKKIDDDPVGYFKNGHRAAYVKKADLAKIFQHEGESYVPILGKVTDCIELSKKIEAAFCQQYPEFKNFITRMENRWEFDAKVGMIFKPILDVSEAYMIIEQIGKKLDLKSCIEFRQIEDEKFQLTIHYCNAYELARKLDKIVGLPPCKRSLERLD